MQRSRLYLTFLVCLSAQSFALVACTQEEAPNPPATRNGTEQTEPTPGASLPGASDPTVGAKKPDDTSSSSSSTKDAGPQLPSGPTSGVDTSKTIAELSSSEKKQLCDWQAGINGGYGKSTSCPDGLTVSGPKSQSACVAKFPSTCNAPVGDVESCLKVDAKDPCALAILKAPECESLRSCLQ